MKSLLENWRAKAAGVVGGAMLVVGASALEAKAEDATPISNSAVTSHQEELRLLRLAESNATLHSEAGYNVGLVLHVGDDIPPQHLQTVIDHYENFYRAEMLKSDDPRVRAGSVKIYPSPNPGTSASGFSATIGGQPYQIDNEKYGRNDEEHDPGLFGLITIERIAPELVSQIPAAKVIQIQNEREQTASLSSYTPGG